MGSTSIRSNRPTDQRSRPQRWRDAVNILLRLQAEYANWLEALPDSLQDSATAEALEAIVGLDLTSLADIEPPRGYGRNRTENRAIEPIREKKRLDLNNPNQRRLSGRGTLAFVREHSR